MNIQNESTQHLREMRDYQEEVLNEGLNIMTDYSLGDIINELARREAKVIVDKIPCDDEYNPVLDRSQSFAPPQSI